MLTNWFRSHSTVLGIVTAVAAAYMTLSGTPGIHIPEVPGVILTILGLLGIPVGQHTLATNPTAATANSSTPASPPSNTGN